MKPLLRLSAALAASALLCSCASTSLVKTWKTPERPAQPVGKVAVVVVDERGMLREVLEGQFSAQLRQRGHETIKTHELMSLQEMKDNRERAVGQVREAGAEAVLLVRLLDVVSYEHSVRQTPGVYLPVTTGMGTGYDYYGWYNYYEVAFMDMGTIHSNLRQKMYLENNLFDLKSGKVLWRGVSKTSMDESTDRLAEVKPLVSAVLAGMAKDGVVR